MPDPTSLGWASVLSLELPPDESCEPISSPLSLRPAQRGHELYACRREVERHRVVEEQPAEPPHHRPLGPRISPNPAGPARLEA